jgi:hypothetical protein
MKWGVYVLPSLGLTLFVAACVGDTATPNPGTDAGTAGEEGSACYPDDTCNKNKPWLKCLSKLCVNVGTDGGGTDAATDSGGDATPDATTDAADGGSLTCASQSQAVANTVRCANGQNCGLQCCNTNGTLSCDPTCITGPDFTLACDDSLDCPTGNKCCLDSTIGLLLCPVVLNNTRGSKCLSACSGSQIQMCGLGDACPSKKQCVKTTINGTEFGICVD